MGIILFDVGNMVLFYPYL